MSPFSLLQPKTLRDAGDLLASSGSDVRPLSGGTALMLMMKAGVLKPRALVSLRKIEPGFGAIELRPDGELHIGALVTMSQLEHSPEVRRAASAIARCMTRLSNVRVRNVATVGGNLAHGDPHMDLPPLLAAMDSHVIVVGPKGERRVQVDALITGYYETVLADGELISRLIVPAQAGLRTAYAKVTTRSADDWPALGVAASLGMEGDTVKTCRLFVGAATDRPTRLVEAEAILNGSALDAATLKRAGQAAAASIDVLADAQGSGSYKKELLQIHLGRVVRTAAAEVNTAGK